MSTSAIDRTSLVDASCGYAQRRDGLEAHALFLEMIIKTIHNHRESRQEDSCASTLERYHDCVG